jgi:hypothetical protein
MDQPNECPECHASMVGGVVPERQRKLFGGAMTFGRAIAVYDRERDRVAKWRCPDCGHEWTEAD